MDNSQPGGVGKLGGRVVVGGPGGVEGATPVGGRIPSTKEGGGGGYENNVVSWYYQEE